MKFGKEFRIHLEETLPEWRDKFLCYKPLKKLLKHFPATATAVDSLPPQLAFYLHPHLQPPTHINHHAFDPTTSHLMDLQGWFVRILNEELDKFNDFYVDKEEEFVIRFQELKERIERVKERSNKDGVFTSESEFGEEMMDIRRDFVSIHGEMVLLQNYSSLNFAGLVKILKKYDKRTGGLLCLPFTQLALHQPFFTIEPLTRLVRECEANIEILFPLEAEVIEATPTTQDKLDQPLNDTANTLSKTPSNLGEETVDIYRGTLAAMRAIKGLQKASSTYNPLSISSLIRNQDDEGTGAVTAENSASNSAATFQNGEDSDQEAHSV
ncbi:hypothetical protein FEM48_Zijuj04G0046800 [Ziziphus jujuba var. spinosa]|uniref:SPX domain-containing protein n=1 Tax=Ziziphus jujuba var. spinosa TaxID=714518 RepID=A0A978VHV2_ZIZJJ|nr:hypothetical protein FEM48_Zijuj04G0046800 [Ziziphus jujuba var. spinosa]